MNTFTFIIFLEAVFCCVFAAHKYEESGKIRSDAIAESSHLYRKKSGREDVEFVPHRLRQVKEDKVKGNSGLQREVLNMEHTDQELASAEPYQKSSPVGVDGLKNMHFEGFNKLGQVKYEKSNFKSLKAGRGEIDRKLIREDNGFSRKLKCGKDFGSLKQQQLPRENTAYNPTAHHNLEDNNKLIPTESTYEKSQSNLIADSFEDQKLRQEDSNDISGNRNYQKQSRENTGLLLQNQQLHKEAQTNTENLKEQKLRREDSNIISGNRNSQKQSRENTDLPLKNQKLHKDQISFENAKNLKERKLQGSNIIPESVNHQQMFSANTNTIVESLHEQKLPLGDLNIIHDNSFSPEHTNSNVMNNQQLGREGLNHIRENSRSPVEDTELIPKNQYRKDANSQQFHPDNGASEQKDEKLLRDDKKSMCEESKFQANIGYISDGLKLKRKLHQGRTNFVPDNPNQQPISHENADSNYVSFKDQKLHIKNLIPENSNHRQLTDENLINKEVSNCIHENPVNKQLSLEDTDTIETHNSPRDGKNIARELQVVSRENTDTLPESFNYQELPDDERNITPKDSNLQIYPRENADSPEYDQKRGDSTLIRANSLKHVENGRNKKIYQENAEGLAENDQKLHVDDSNFLIEKHGYQKLPREFNSEGLKEKMLPTDDVVVENTNFQPDNFIFQKIPREDKNEILDNSMIYREKTTGLFENLNEHNKDSIRENPQLSYDISEHLKGQRSPKEDKTDIIGNLKDQGRPEEGNAIKKIHKISNGKGDAFLSSDDNHLIPENPKLVDDISEHTKGQRSPKEDKAVTIGNLKDQKRPEEGNVVKKIQKISKEKGDDFNYEKLPREDKYFIRDKWLVTGGGYKSIPAVGHSPREEADLMYSEQNIFPGDFEFTPKRNTFPHDDSVAATDDLNRESSPLEEHSRRFKNVNREDVRTASANLKGMGDKLDPRYQNLLGEDVQNCPQLQLQHEDTNLAAMIEEGAELALGSLNYKKRRRFANSKDQLDPSHQILLREEIQNSPQLQFPREDTNLIPMVEEGAELARRSLNYEKSRKDNTKYSNNQQLKLAVNSNDQHLPRHASEELPRGYSISIHSNSLNHIENENNKKISQDGAKLMLEENANFVPAGLNLQKLRDNQDNGYSAGFNLQQSSRVDPEQLKKLHHDERKLMNPESVEFISEKLQNPREESYLNTATLKDQRLFDDSNFIAAHEELPPAGTNTVLESLKHQKQSREDANSLSNINPVSDVDFNKNDITESNLNKQLYTAEEHKRIPASLNLKEFTDKDIANPTKKQAVPCKTEHSAKESSIDNNVEDVQKIIPKVTKYQLDNAKEENINLSKTSNPESLADKELPLGDIGFIHESLVDKKLPLGDTELILDRLPNKKLSLDDTGFISESLVGKKLPLGDTGFITESLTDKNLPLGDTGSITDKKLPLGFTPDSLNLETPSTEDVHDQKSKVQKCMREPAIDIKIPDDERFFNFGSTEKSKEDRKYARINDYNKKYNNAQIYKVNPEQRGHKKTYQTGVAEDLKPADENAHLFSKSRIGDIDVDIANMLNSINLFNNFNGGGEKGTKFIDGSQKKKISGEVGGKGADRKLEDEDTPTFVTTFNVVGGKSTHEKSSRKQPETKLDKPITEVSEEMSTASMKAGGGDSTTESLAASELQDSKKLLEESNDEDSSQFHEKTEVTEEGIVLQSLSSKIDEAFPSSENCGKKPKQQRINRVYLTINPILTNIQDPGKSSAPKIQRKRKKAKGNRKHKTEGTNSDEDNKFKIQFVNDQDNSNAATPVIYLLDIDTSKKYHDYLSTGETMTDSSTETSNRSIDVTKNNRGSAEGVSVQSPVRVVDDSTRSKKCKSKSRMSKKRKSTTASYSSDDRNLVYEGNIASCPMDVEDNSNNEAANSHNYTATAIIYPENGVSSSPNVKFATAATVVEEPNLELSLNTTTSPESTKECKSSHHGKSPHRSSKPEHTITTESAELVDLKELADDAMETKLKQDNAASEASAKVREELANRAHQAAEAAQASVADKQVIVALLEELDGLFHLIRSLCQKKDENTKCYLAKQLDQMTEANEKISKISANVSKILNMINELKEETIANLESTKGRLLAIRTRLADEQKKLEQCAKAAELARCKKKKKKKFRLFPWMRRD